MHYSRPPRFFPFSSNVRPLFFPLLSSKRLRRLYFCKSLSRGQQSEMPAFATVSHRPPPVLCVASARCQTPRFISHLHLLLTLFSDWWFNLTLEEVCHSPHHLSTYVPLISCQSHGVGEAVMNSSSCGRSLTVCRWSTSPCSPLYAASNR